MSQLLNELRREPRADPDVPVQVAGDPEKRSARERTAQGIPLSAAELEAFSQLAQEHHVPWAWSGSDAVAAAGTQGRS